MSSILYSNINSPVKINSKLYLENINSLNNYFWIFPTARFQRYFERNYLKNYFKLNNTPLLISNSNNIDDFIKSLYRNHISENFIFIDNNIQFLLIQEAILNSNLKFYTNVVKNSNRYASKFIQVINGILKDGKRNEFFKIDDNVFNRNKVHDIEEILNNYHKIKPSNFKDLVDLKIELSNTDLISNEHSNSIYIFEYFNEFNPSDLELLKKLKDSNYKIQIILDYDEDIGPDYSILKESIKELLKLDFNIKNNFDDDNSRKLHIKTNLFKENIKNNVSINCFEIQADSVFDEVNKIGIEIKQLYKKGVDLSDIYIVSRETEKYYPYFKKIFNEIGIPINISERPNLFTSIPVTNIKYLIDCFIYGFNNNNLKNILSSNLIDLGDKEFVNKELKENAIRAINYLREDHDDLNDRIKSIENANVDPDILDNINSLKIVLKLLESLQNLFFETNKIEDHTLFVKKLINSSNVFTNTIDNNINGSDYDKYLQTRNNEANSRSLTAFLKVLEDIERTHNILHKNRPISFNQFYNNLIFALENTKFQIKELFDFGVTFTSIEQTRGIEKPIIFSCGMVDGKFPLEYKTDKFIGKDLRYKEIKHDKSEKVLFYDLLKNSLSFDNNKIYFSYPVSESGVELEPSSYLNFLRRICEINKLHIESSVYELKNNNSFLNPNKLDKLINGEILINQLSYKSKNILNEHKNRPISTSRLNTFAQNPFDYLTKYIYKGDSEQELGLEFSNLEKGNLIHHILNKFFVCLSENQKNLIELNGLKMSYVNLDLNKHSNYLKLLETISSDVFNDYPKNEFTQLELDFFSNKKYNRFILEKWLRSEFEYKKCYPDYYPTYFEYDLGHRGVAIAENIRIIGKIDRIDINFRNSSFNLIDYKTGSTITTKSSFLNLEQFQMSLYSFAINTLISDILNKNFTYNASFYIKLTSSDDDFNNIFNPVLVMDSTDNDKLKSDRNMKGLIKQERYDQLFEDTLVFIKAFKDQIAEGNFFDNENSKYNVDLIRAYEYF